MIILVTLIFTPLLIPLQFIKYLFIAMGLNEHICQLAATYIRIVAPGILTYSWAVCYSSYATQQGKPKYTLISNIVASLVHWYMAYYFGLTLNWKMTGVALSSSI